MADEVQTAPPAPQAPQAQEGEGRREREREGRRPSGPGGGRGEGGGRKFFRRKKIGLGEHTETFRTEKIDAVPYRDVRLLQGFVAERGKIVPRRLTGVCTKHQRRLTKAIKQARNIALLPFAARF